MSKPDLAREKLWDRHQVVVERLEGRIAEQRAEDPEADVDFQEANSL